MNIQTNKIKNHMVRHIVMFRFRDDASEIVRTSSREAFKSGIEALPQTIPFIKSIHVGFNTNPAEKWDICLESTFSDLDEVRAYSAHPAHKAVAAALMRNIGERACVDFEI